MSLDLNKLANKLDEALSNETTETLTKFLTDKRMSNNKQSSIEWLQAIELERDLTLADWNKAKAMHEEEMKNFTEDWYFYGPLLGEGIDVKNTIEQHFNNTYGGGDK